MKFCENGHMAISRVDFWSFINELCMRSPNLGIPALEDGLFVNLSIFDYVCTCIYKCPRMSQYKLPYGERVTRVAVDGGELMPSELYHQEGMNMH